jgi:hypothetical protein
VNAESKNHGIGRWVLRTVLLWPVVGMVSGAVGITIIATTFESLAYQDCVDIECGEAMGTQMAMIFSPVIGFAWGLVAGLIGSLVGLVTRSPTAYGVTMAVLAVGPYTPFLADILRRWIWTLTIISFVVALLTAAAVCAFARRRPPPPRTPEFGG